jgi:2-dehydropantoate 2-reductase
MKKKVLIAGIGGVGGFIGAKLAKFAESNPDIEIYFLCRGKNLEAINENGIELIEPNRNTVAYPFKSSDNCANFPIMDAVVLACKSYDLESMCDLIAATVSDKTLIVPLLNGIKHSDYLKHRFRTAIISSAFIYIVSKLERPGQVLMDSKQHSLYFGNDGSNKNVLLEFEKLLVDAGINAHCVSNIDEHIWRKFTFISPIATYTSAYNLSKQDIAENENHLNQLKGLMREIIQLSRQLGILLPENILDLHVEQFLKLPDNSSSSMHRDYLFGKQTEIESLSEFIVIESKKLALDTPIYEELIYKIKNQTCYLNGEI